MLKVLTGEQLIKGSSVDIPKLVDPFLPKVGVASLAGSSDTGKSTMLQQLASAIVVGDDKFLGFQLNATHNNVIYLSTEDDPAAVGARLIKQSEGSYEADQLVNLRFIFEYENLIDDLDKELQRQKADCVIIDAFADVFGDNDINQVSKVRSFVNRFNELALKHQCLFLILHHIGKRTENLAPSKDSLIGSQGFEAKMRVVLFLQKDPKDSTLRHLSIVKGNYLSAAVKDQTYILKFEDNLLFTNTDTRMPMSMFTSKRQALNQKEWLPRAIALKETGLALIPISKQLAQEGYTNCGKSVVGMELSKHYAAQQEKGTKPLFTIDDIDFDELNEYNENDDCDEDMYAMMNCKD